MAWIYVSIFALTIIILYRPRWCRTPRAGSGPVEECVGEEGRDPAEECVGECAVVNEVHNVNANFDAEAHVWSLPVEGGTQ